MTFTGGKLIYTFTCDARCTDITYTVQATASLLTGSWTDMAVSVGGGAVLPNTPVCEVTDADAGLRRVTVAIPAAIFPTPYGFLRVRISE